MVNWSELSEDMVDLIVKPLNCVDDFVRFGAVNKACRSIAIRQKQKPFGPWLMLMDDEDTRTFCSLSIHTEDEKLFKVQLPEAKGRRCWGSSYGWLLTLGSDFVINLLNPLTRLQISLPSLATYRPRSKSLDAVLSVDDLPDRILRVFMHKFALSSNPSCWTDLPTKSCLVMATFGPFQELALASPGDEAWTTLECPPGSNEDVIFFKGQFYAVNTRGVLRLCKTDTTPPKAIDIASPPDRVGPIHRFYLIEILGDLHLVARFFDADEDVPSAEFHIDTDHIEVFRFDFHTNKWSLLYDLGDHALFIGNNTSFAISTSTHSNFKPNCIYYTDDDFTSYPRPFCDMGVLDYGKETLEPLDFGEDALSKFSRPLFFMPSP